MVPILVILTFACFILIEIALEHRARKKAEVSVRQRSESAAMSIPPRVSPASWGYALPGGVFLHPGHTWAHLELTGEARVGIDDFIRMIMGKVDGVLLPRKGSSVQQGGKLLTLVKGKRQMDVASPLDGVVQVVNDYVALSPERITRDPYQAGWILEIRPTKLLKNIRRLRVGAEASQWFEKELERFSEFIDRNMERPAEVGVTARDGGLYLTGIVEEMDDALFEKLTRTFFMV